MKKKERNETKGKRNQILLLSPYSRHILDVNEGCPSATNSTSSWAVKGKFSFPRIVAPRRARSSVQLP